MARVTYKDAALILASTITVLVVLEVGLRVIQYVRDGTHPLVFLPNYRERTFQRSPFLPFGPRVNWSFEREGDPAWTRFNDMGIRMPDALPAPEGGEFRVLALGGSTTENVWNELGIHWPLAVECMARREGKRNIQVLNAAMSAYSTAHSLVRYQLDLVDTDPDLVLIMHNINDLTVSYHAAAEGKAVDPNYLVKYGAKSYAGQVDESDVVVSRLASFLRASLLPTPSPDVPSESWVYDLGEGERLLRRNLGYIVQSVRASGATPVLLTMPRSGDSRWVDLARGGDLGTAGLTLLPSSSRFFEDFDRFNDVIREVAEVEGVPLVDMSKELVEDADTFVDIVHYSTEGIRSFAATLYARLNPHLPGPGGELFPGAVTCDGVL